MYQKNKILTYEDSRYFRGHDNITKDGIELVLGESYLREDGKHWQVLSVGCIGDCNVLLECGGKMQRVHAGIIFENRIVCGSDEVQRIFKERETKYRDDIRNMIIAVYKENKENKDD